jgi:hypothetical protein
LTSYVIFGKIIQFSVNFIYDENYIN